MNVNDPLRHLYDVSVQWCWGLPDCQYYFLYRLVMLLAIPTILAGTAFRCGSRASMIQWLCLTVGVLLAFVVPLGDPPRNAHVKAWTLVFAVLLLGFLPAILPTFLIRQYGPQSKLRLALYAGVGIALLIGLGPWSWR
jgi:hypothetical protein